jgi:hypothetical protein
VFAAGALIFPARNFALSRRTLHRAEQGQVTERYTKAIEQLGSDKFDVRIGGIYALERVERDSARDQPTVMEVLAAFVREHSREQLLPDRATTTVGQIATGSGAASFSGLIEAPARSTRPDVQAAVRVIGRRDSRWDQEDVERSQLLGPKPRGPSRGRSSQHASQLPETHGGNSDRGESHCLKPARLEPHRSDIAGADLMRTWFA